MALLVAIVNYRSAPWTERCLLALKGQLAELSRGAEGTPVDVVVVDNDSQDGSTERLSAFVGAHGLAPWVRVIPAAQNGGFSFGNNLALEAWRAIRAPEPDDGVLLLNPDTEPRPGSLRTLLDFLARHPRVGIAGARLEFENGVPQACAFRFLGARTECIEALGGGAVARLLGGGIVFPSGEEPAPVDWVSGACMLVRYRVFEEVGPMDEGFFLYYEELEFTRRAARAGWERWHVPAARVVHHVGKTTGVTAAEDSARRRPRYWYASRQRYHLLRGGPLGALGTNAIAVLADLAGGLAALLRRRKRDRPAHYLRDLLRQSLAAPLEPGRVPSRRAGPRFRE